MSIIHSNAYWQFCGLFLPFLTWLSLVAPVGFCPSLTCSLRASLKIGTEHWAIILSLGPPAHTLGPSLYCCFWDPGMLALVGSQPWFNAAPWQWWWQRHQCTAAAATSLAQLLILKVNAPALCPLHPLPKLCKMKEMASLNVQTQNE